MVICPKCEHVRPKDATNPEWQCPACGVCYAKVGANAQPRSRAPEAPVAVKHDWNLGLVAKVAAVVVLGWGLSVALRNRQPADDEAEVDVAEVQQQPSSSGSFIADAAFKVADMDAARLLQDLGPRVEKSCARNKYGLSEEACIDRIRSRGDMCASQAAARFPGKVADTGRMQQVVGAYAGCVFER
jgi:hypothetical protein